MQGAGVIKSPRREATKCARPPLVPKAISVAVAIDARTSLYVIAIAPRLCARKIATERSDRHAEPLNQPAASRPARQRADHDPAQVEQAGGCDKATP